MPQVAGFIAVQLATAGVGSALATWLGSAAVRLLTSVALGLVASKLVKKAEVKNLPAGVRTSVTQSGGVNPVSFVLGEYATAGTMICPPMSRGSAGGPPNYVLTYVVNLGDIRGMALNRVAVDGVWISLSGSVDANGFFPATGDYANKVWVKYYDGSQTTADAFLLANYGSYPSRPWLSDMIGRDQCYAILEFRFDSEVFNGFPQVMFEVSGIPLYDPRLDSTVGGSGAHRWANKATWEPSKNPKVQQYNILRGISFADGTIWGGEATAADLPLSEWFADMNACDVNTPMLSGGTQKAYRSGIEVRVDDEPMSILEELDKACSGDLIDMGGVWKTHVGSVGASVLSITDADIIVTKPQEFDPFPGLSDTFNGVTATYPDPTSLYAAISAPVRTDATDEAADGGRRLMADLTFSAVPHADQVQRLMEAYRLDNRRFRHHSITLGPAAMKLEPGDAIDWTSATNGYTAKVFEVVTVIDDIMTGLQRLMLRERDSADYNWTAATDTLPFAPTPALKVTPAAQTPASVVITAITLTDDSGTQTRPAIRVAWNGVDQGDVEGVKYQVRRVADGVTILRGSTHDVDSGETVIADGIMPTTAYQVRVRFVARRRATAWTSWTATAPSTTVAVGGLPAGAIASIAANTLLGNNTGSPAVPTALTRTQALVVLQIPPPFAARSNFVTWWAAAPTVAVGTIASAGGVDYRYDAASTAISDLLGWVPLGDVVDDHFNGSISAMRAYLDGLTNTEHGYVRGSVSHSLPIVSDSDRSASISGMTVMSNINELGSATLYTGTGKTKAIASATNANPAVFTSTAHGFTAGERTYTKDVAGGTWAAALNGGPWLIAGVTTNTFTLTDDLGAAFSGVGLGTLTGGTIRNEGAIAGWVLGGSFMQSYAGLAMRTTQGVEHIVWVHAENYVTTSGVEADFSGSLTRFDGVQFAPQTVDVTVAGVLVENHKFASFRDCWWIRGVSGSPGLKLGVARTQSPNTLIGGAAVHTAVDNNFIFANMVLENVEGLRVQNSQFDSTSFAIGLNYAGLGVAADVSVYGCSFVNDGGADGTGLAAMNQAPVIMTSPTLVWTSGWSVSTNTYRDWPIGVKLEAGWASLTANNFRGRQAGDIGVVIGENVVGESIDHTNNFLQMLANGNKGVVDRRYKSITVLSATAANPVVIGVTANHINNGDRIRLYDIGGMTQINNREFIAQGVTSTTMQLYTVDDNGGSSAPVNGTGYSSFTAGGSVTRPYHWHRQTVYANSLALGHGSFVFDLALDQNATLAAGDNNVLNLDGVVITGGLYEVVYSAVIDMAAVTGTVKFAVTLNGNVLPELYSAFQHQGSANTEIAWTFRKVIWMDAETLASGALMRLRVNAPGAVVARGKASGADGQTFMQVRRVT